MSGGVMQNILQRYSDNGDDTLGLMFSGMEFNLAFAGHTLEDEKRIKKVSGETRIPAGLYELNLRKVLSPLTQKYRDLFGFFTWHVQIMGVPGFDYVYVHVGNKEEHTDACVLIGDGANNNTIAPGFVSSSRLAFQRWYVATRDHLEAGGRATVEIRDEDWIVRSMRAGQ